MTTPYLSGTASFSGYHEDGDECVQCVEGEYMDLEGGIEFCEFCPMGEGSTPTTRLPTAARYHDNTTVTLTTLLLP